MNKLRYKDDAAENGDIRQLFFSQNFAKSKCVYPIMSQVLFYEVKM